MQNYFETNPNPLFATEFDYFRISRELWELMLVRLKQMGANAVAVTLPWGFHEIQPGTVDLNGTTSARRNVVEAMRLCTVFNLPCVLSPGPYGDGGLLGEGIPAWLLKDNQNLDDVLPPAVKRWYKAVSQALVDQQWPAGPIVALQINGEPAGGRSPRLSPQLTEVQWPIWLRKRYEGIDELNLAYGSSFRTVSEVEFPRTWANESTPLEKDAKKFLDEMRGNSQDDYAQILLDAGWQIPVYPTALDTSPDLPLIHSHSLTASAQLPALGRGQKMLGRRVILKLQHPIQIEPDPVDVGGGSVWAENAPIRADGSVRPKFWAVRQYLWKHTAPKIAVIDESLTHPFKDGLLVTRHGDASLKVETTLDSQATAYRLKFSGELVADDNLKVRRGKLAGLYVSEDNAGQTDLVFLLTDPETPLKGFLLDYLRDGLLRQIQVLTRCARLAERMGKMLAPVQPEEKITQAGRPRATSYTLEEARRGLSEADAALRKAMTSINALSDGFATILDQERLEVGPQSATSPLAISPEVFEDEVREILIEVGAVCAEIAPQLKSAAGTVQKTADAALFTIDQYQQSYTTAITAARDVRKVLGEVITRIRLDLASERLPLITWRIHDQVQAITEGLRRGVS
ncbi:MAG: beta-galactosidase [Anaerolineae bacterium]|nr:beta-galactosidase [Anaerolineae bacterium]